MNTKPTPGPWLATEARYSDTCDYEVIAVDGEYSDTVAGEYGIRKYADALLIAEAGTVAHETGLTPRQLAEQRAELLTALENLRTWKHGNENVPPMHNGDEPWAWADAVIATARGGV